MSPELRNGTIYKIQIHFRFHHTQTNNIILLLGVKHIFHCKKGDHGSPLPPPPQPPRECLAPSSAIYHSLVSLECNLHGQFCFDTLCAFLWFTFFFCPVHRYIYIHIKLFHGSHTSVITSTKLQLWSFFLTRMICKKHTLAMFFFFKNKVESGTGL